MTISEYIEQKFQKFGIELSDADILDISLKSGINVNDNVTSDNHTPVTIAIVRFIPELLLRASSFTENKLSMTWDMKGLKAFYSMMCREYGLDDMLNDERPTVTFWQ